MKLAEAIIQGALEAQTFVIIFGDLFDGIQGVIGPFKSKDKAEAYGDSHSLAHYQWSAEELELPSHE